MTDIKKVIKGLEICSEHSSWHGLDCELNEAYKDCPYRGCETGCVVMIAKDAIALLKGQEVGMTEKEFMTHIITEICDYSVENDMEPDDTLSTIADNLKSLLEISTFNGCKRR